MASSAKRELNPVLALAAVRAVVSAWLGDDAKSEFISDEYGLTLSIDWRGRNAEFTWESGAPASEYPNAVVEARSRRMCDELLHGEQRPTTSVRRRSQRVAVEEPVRTPSVEALRIAASVTTALERAIANGTRVHVITSGDVLAGKPVRVFEGIPRVLEIARDGQVRVVLEVIPNELEQRVLLDRIAMVTEIPHGSASRAPGER